MKEINEWLNTPLFSACFDWKHAENSCCYGSVKEIDAAVAAIPCGNRTRDFLLKLLDEAARDLIEELACAGDHLRSPAQVYCDLRSQLKAASWLEAAFTKFFGVPVNCSHEWAWPNRDTAPAEETVKKTTL